MQQNFGSENYSGNTGGLARVAPGVFVETEKKTVPHGPGYDERAAAEAKLTAITAAVDEVAFKNGKEQPVKIRMHHGAVILAGRQNAILAIERGAATLVK